MVIAKSCAQPAGVVRFKGMRWRALATDFDGTLATEGVVSAIAKLALSRMRAAGIRVILVTGRELTDFATLDISLNSFDLVVAENGALLHDPHTGLIEGLGEPPPENFIKELARRGVAPLSAGASIVATVEPHETVVLELIRDMGLEHQVIFNKGAVMILPPGVNKATGLRAALERLSIAPADVVAAGDAENDHALLEMCGLPVAVTNAIPSLKERALWVTTKPDGEGMVELMEGILDGTFDALERQEAVA
jgi:hydroxymethylpyrimidine pyrophosphatase-like HAD family hydrolase